jgi:cytoskeletal protein CcmA (bactofilin family)
MVRGPVATGAPSGRTVEDGGASTLGRSARVRGRIAGEGDLRILGEVEGDVSVSGELTLDDGGSLTGDVDAGAVVVGGALKGDVASRGPVAVRATARIEGDLAGTEVSIDEGAAFHGRIDVEFDFPEALGEPLPGRGPQGPPAKPGSHPSTRGR